MNALPQKQGPPFLRLCVPGLIALAAAAAIVSLKLPPAGIALLICWALLNASLALTAAVWGLAHFRSLLPAFPAAWRWGLACTVLAALSWFSTISTEVVERTGFALSSGLLFLLGLLTFGSLLVSLLVLAFDGAAIGHFLYRAEAEPVKGARVGSVVWFLLVISAWIAAAWIIRYLGVGPAVALAVSFPVLIAVACEAIRRYDPHRSLRALAEAAGRRLIVRMPRGSGRSMDLRGVALGLVAGVLALGLSSGFLLPLRAGLLVTLIRVRNEPLFSGGSVSLATWVRKERTDLPERLVLLEMDPVTRRAALTRQSESAVQAEVVRLLSRWGAERIVLPLPMVNRHWRTPSPSGGELPDVTRENIRRTLQDLPLLERAVRESGRVVLAVPRVDTELFGAAPGFPDVTAGIGTLRDQATRDAISRLKAAASVTGQQDLDTYASRRLPAIPLRGWQGSSPDVYLFPPIPLVLLSGPATGAPVPEFAARREVEIAGKRLPTVGGDRILVEFTAAQPGQGFPRVSYASARAGEKIFAFDTLRRRLQRGSDSEGGRWQPPAEYFKGKIVFLDSLAPRSRSTPIGDMPRMELLAHATTTLLSGRTITPVSPAVLAAGTLLAGILVGALCVGRGPVAAVGWSAGAAFMSLVLTLLLFLFNGVWLDSVALIGAAVGATVLMSQLTYAVDRQEKQRQRNLLQRFAPPQIIDQLLDDPHSLSLGGSRSKVCVLFADVRNFTRFAERHSPEEVIEVTNTYLVAMTGALHHFGGFLGTYTGDGLMGFFLAETEADVERAVHAALAMRDAAVGVSQRMPAEGREPLNIGIGVHYGEAVVGLVGSPERPDYTVIGHTVIVSHRLQSIALGGEVVLSEAAYDACGQAIEAEEGDPVQVKGLSAPVRPYRVSGVRPALPPPAPEPVTAL